MRTNQIIKVKQDKIPAIADNEYHLSLKKDKFLLETKPHGHGDNIIYYINQEKLNNGFKKVKNIWFYLWILMFLLLIVFQYLLDQV
jgi:UDP-N-acetylglucosamine pyrophosphorylase